MSNCTETHAAAYRFFYQLTHNEPDALRNTFSSRVEYHHCRLDGLFQTDQIDYKGIENVSWFLKEKVFKVTSNFVTKEWSVKCHNLTAECDYVIELDKNEPAGRYSVQGHVKIVFIRKPSENDLRITKIWDATTTIKL